MSHERLIVVDENIPFGAQAFSTIGKAVTLPGRSISRSSVQEAEILCVRSVTQVNAELLEGTSVKFVATATIGVDHIDQEYLHSHGIGFANAPGSNANSVAEYVVAALLVVAERKGIELPGQTLGVVGVGNVGSRVVAKARALGMKTILNDPPLARRTGEEKYRPLQELLDGSDIVTLHVPLTRAGQDPTFHLADERFLAQLKDGAVFLNTSRGPVVDTPALREAIERGHISATVLDVWENEPDIDAGLLELADIGTPHIAGYSYDGKVKGTQMIYDAACSFFGLDPVFDPAPLMPRPEVPAVTIPEAADGSAQRLIAEAVLSVYDIRKDDENLRKILDMNPAERGPCFDQLRKNYPRRREFYNTAIAESGPRAVAETLLECGFGGG